MSLLPLLLCCAGRSEPASAPPAPTTDAFVGSWRSAPCGERTWERTLTLAADGSYEGSDPVSPCPPGARCIWSGIVAFGGSWAPAAGGVALTETRGTHAEQYPRPPTLSADGEGLVDPAGCRYVRG